MLPSKPFSCQQFKRVLANFDANWQDLTRRHRLALMYSQALKTNLFLINNLKEQGVQDSQIDLVTRQGIYLLFATLGPYITRTLIDYEATSVIIAACNLVLALDLDDPQNHLANTTVISVLCELTLSAHPSDQMQHCTKILNHLALPLYLHQAVLMNVGNITQGVELTRH